MSSNELIWNSIESLYNWVKNENFYGWDPYDALNSRVIENICMGSRLLEILAIQSNKYSIVNLRPFLNVKKGRGLGLRIEKIEGNNIAVTMYAFIYGCCHFTNSSRLPDGSFTNIVLAKKLGISVRLAQKITYCLRKMKVLIIEGKKKRELVFRVHKDSEIISNN